MASQSLLYKTGGSAPRGPALQFLKALRRGEIRRLQGIVGCGTLKRVQDLDILVAAVGLEVFRQQVPGAGTLGSGEDEGVPVGELGGIHPMPGLLDQADRGVHGPPMRQVFHDLAGPRRPSTKPPATPWLGPVSGTRRDPRSTGSATLMRLLAGHALGSAGGGQWAVRFPVLERPPVIVGQPHLALEHFAGQAGERGVFLGCFSACPRSGFIGNSDGHVSGGGFSVARNKC
jgi:hypothetical protein